MIVRTVDINDRDALWQIAQITGVGFSSLQPDPEVVNERFEWAIHSLGASEPLQEAFYLFVLEDSLTGEVVGVSGIESAVGLNAPWYNYKINTQVHASKELDVYNRVDTLTLCSDYTGYSELCMLFLKPDYRHSNNGHLLSKCRFLFMAAHASRFNPNVMAEMRGYCDEEGESPFWEALGRHFFSVNFVEADRQVPRGKAFIAELMPRNPVYVNLLPESAQQVIGQTHQETAPARKLLESEGFRYNRYVDIFDGGPVLEARTEEVRSILHSSEFTVSTGSQQTTDKTVWLIANNRLEAFRCIIGRLSFNEQRSVNLDEDQVSALGVKSGDIVRIVPLFGKSPNTEMTNGQTP